MGNPAEREFPILFMHMDAGNPDVQKSRSPLHASGLAAR
jgi:hypothetical protein